MFPAFVEFLTHTSPMNGDSVAPTLLFAPVLAHRVVFTPSFVARARASGWEAAIDEFRRACFAAAPRPGSEADPLFEQPRSV